jgi:hypothetical protein
MAATALIMFSLLLGAIGYVYFEAHSWHDGFLNGAMMLGGLGPLHPPSSNSGKIFVGIFALYSGLIFAATIGMMLAPVAHRVLHRFHWESGEE